MNLFTHREKEREREEKKTLKEINYSTLFCTLLRNMWFADLNMREWMTYEHSHSYLLVC